MKSPDPEGIPRIDVSSEELEALLEQARPALAEDGYQKLKSRDPHAGLCDRAAGEAGSDAGVVARVVVSCQHGEDREGAEAGRHRDRREEIESAAAARKAQDAPGMGAMAPRRIAGRTRSKFRTRR